MSEKDFLALHSFLVIFTMPSNCGSVTWLTLTIKRNFIFFLQSIKAYWLKELIYLMLHMNFFVDDLI